MSQQDDRPPIPAPIERQLMKEYNYRCAICGVAVPQIHHIDGNRKNNDISNLLPVCPNCHLLDQHNPTRKIEPRLLRLFREHKDPAILAPQFVPLFQRMEFMEGLHALEENPIRTVVASPEFHAARSRIISQVFELLRLVRHLNMGEFFAFQICTLLIPDVWLQKSHGNAPSDKEAHESLDWRLVVLRNWMRDTTPEEAEDRIYQCRYATTKLIVEQLRFQDWDVSRAHRWSSLNTPRIKNSAIIKP
jgi:hypothetical protein